MSRCRRVSQLREGSAVMGELPNEEPAPTGAELDQRATGQSNAVIARKFAAMVTWESFHCLALAKIALRSFVDSAFRLCEDSSRICSSMIPSPRLASSNSTRVTHGWLAASLRWSMCRFSRVPAAPLRLAERIRRCSAGTAPIVFAARPKRAAVS